MSGPLQLHFYMSDTYDGQAERLGKDWLGQEDFRGQLTLKGRRFKQVLIDGELIWEQDIADAAGPSVPKQFSVPIPSGLDPAVEHEVTRPRPLMWTRHRRHAPYTLNSLW